MNILRLNLEKDILNRNEMRIVIGGYGSGGPTGGCDWVACTSAAQCGPSCSKCVDNSANGHDDMCE